VCRQWSAWVKSKTVPGLGRWGTAWELVEAPSNAFLDALRAWEASGSPSDFTALEGAYQALARAWLLANQRFLESTPYDSEVTA